MIELFDKLPGPIRRLLLVVGWTLFTILFIIAWGLALTWSVVGILPASLVWIATGVWHDTLKPLVWIGGE